MGSVCKLRLQVSYTDVPRVWVWALVEPLMQFCWVLGHLLNQGSSCSLSVARRSSLGETLPFDSNFLHFTVIDATVLLRTLRAWDTILSLYPDPCLSTLLSQMSAGSSSEFMSWFSSWHVVYIVGPYIPQMCSFVDYVQVLDTFHA